MTDSLHGIIVNVQLINAEQFELLGSVDGLELLRGRANELHLQ